MNGDEATAILRQRGCAVPIIGITGDAHHEDLDEFLSKGANEVLAGAGSRLMVGREPACVRRCAPSPCRVRSCRRWWTSTSTEPSSIALGAGIVQT